MCVVCTEFQAQCESGWNYRFLQLEPDELYSEMCTETL